MANLESPTLSPDSAIAGGYPYITEVLGTMNSTSSESTWLKLCQMLES